MEKNQSQGRLKKKHGNWKPITLYIHVSSGKGVNVDALFIGQGKKISDYAKDDDKKWARFSTAHQDTMILE